MRVNLRKQNESAHLFLNVTKSLFRYNMCLYWPHLIFFKTKVCIHIHKPTEMWGYGNVGISAHLTTKQLKSAIRIGKVALLAHRAFSHSIHTDTQRIVCSLSSFTQHGFLIPISFKGLGKVLECKLPKTLMLFKVRNVCVAAMWIVRSVSVKRQEHNGHK